nr:MaoC family dehydratase [Amylibacter sp.]
MFEIANFTELSHHVGHEFAPSGWVCITQDMIDGFAKLTGDTNWYHLDVDRAARELPRGRTLAHGLLALSLVPGLSQQIFRVTAHGRALNYGYDKLRFPAPVENGARLRLHMRVMSSEPAKSGLMIRRSFTMEREGSDRPALVTEALTLAYFDPPTQE